MKVKLGDGVRLREDDFGGISYVPSRDDFFALDRPVFSMLSGFGREFTTVDRRLEPAVRILAQVGVLSTTEPRVSEKTYCGPSFIGDFRELVTISEPLVVNCFATAFCPLACVYCHADDLMKAKRDTEHEDEIAQVVATATSVSSLVAVITGGDPITRPERAIRLIEELSKHKALVLDTSGAGEIEKLMPVLVENQVHVRVSIDSVTRSNDQLRPINSRVYAGSTSSFEAAEKALDACMSNGLPVTVQTVLTRKNDRPDDLDQLKEWLLTKGVKHWVLHIAIEGGSARTYEQMVRRQKRPESLIPKRPHIHKTLRDLITTSRDSIDIRCTDTGTTPNSVLLVDSNGDLYTEGLAKQSKVKLYDAGVGRPDELKKHWAHVDRFGHARRYLNWNPWLYVDRSLEDICLRVKLPKRPSEAPGFVETEAKHRIADIDMFNQILARLNAESVGCVLQRDEYFDSEERALDAHDFVLRLRYIDEETLIAIKGRRFDSEKYDISRIELEFPARSREEIVRLIAERDLRVTWFLEKRRHSFLLPQTSVKVELDEIPEIGWFVEFEGTISSIRDAETKFAEALGSKERRNYKELVLDAKATQGIPASSVLGAEFS